MRMHVSIHVIISECMCLAVNLQGDPMVLTAMACAKQIVCMWLRPPMVESF